MGKLRRGLSVRTEGWSAFGIFIFAMNRVSAISFLTPLVSAPLGFAFVLRDAINYLFL